ncbi:hypothetical protein TDIS_1247 [Thermosulfurimonas dismutans]|uniref:Uncharacterized protein n=1 Tax=Thermosulfurimonas dismutans TaxID=999894 RepID=A0A179D599_9BACT|nr:hypothetical protein TDIS_1247 [Thermosulfurimonas dismutans]
MNEDLKRVVLDLIARIILLEILNFEEKEGSEGGGDEDGPQR